MARLYRCKSRHRLSEIRRSVVGKGLEIGERREARPRRLGRRSELSEDERQLIVDVLAGEERSARVCHFGENETGRPAIDRRRIVASAEQYVGRSVPERDHFGRVAFHRNAKCACQAEVGEL